MMNMVRNVLVAALALLIIVSCKKDDDGGPTVEPPRDFGEVALESQEIFEAFLSTHFYNYEEFETEAPDFDYKIRFDTISGANSDKTSLMEQVIVKTIKRGGVDHKLYVLVAREGEGVKPHFADSTLVNYEGNVPYKNKFDFSVTPVWFDLASAAPAAELYTQSPNALDGFANALPEFGVATEVGIGADGSTTYSNDYGIGAIFIPTGLAYYNSRSGTIAPYENLIIKIELIAFKETDHDRDGIPSYLEDINGNNYVNDLGDDTDGDRVPDYLDTDDDGDGTPTREEINLDEDGNLILPFPDSDNDGVPDYLDPDIS